MRVRGPAPAELHRRADLTTSARAPGLPAADAQGLSFSASRPRRPAARRGRAADSRSTATATSTPAARPASPSASDYAQVSTDGGDQFHLLGDAAARPAGLGRRWRLRSRDRRQANAQGNFQYAYAGLGPLTGFTTSTSPDNGHTSHRRPAGTANTGRAAAPTASGSRSSTTTTALISYNQQQPRNIVVQKSTDGGLTYRPADDAIALAEPGLPGPMHSMPASSTRRGQAYVAYFGWNSTRRQLLLRQLRDLEDAASTGTTAWSRRSPVDDSGGLGAFTSPTTTATGNIYLAYADKQDLHTYL